MNINRISPAFNMTPAYERFRGSDSCGSLTRGQLGHFDQAGYVVISDLIPEDEIPNFKADMNRALDAVDSGETRKTSGGALRVALGAFNPLREDNESSPIYNFATDPKTIEIIQSVLGPNIAVHHSKLLPNPPRSGGGFLWHQDSAYWLTDPITQVALWVLLDNAGKENGTIQIIPESHQWGIIEHWKYRVENMEEGKLQPAINFGDLVLALLNSYPEHRDEINHILSLPARDIKLILMEKYGVPATEIVAMETILGQSYEEPDVARRLLINLLQHVVVPYTAVEVKAGEGVLFASTLWHSSCPNRSDLERNAFLIEYEVPFSQIPSPHMLSGTSQKDYVVSGEIQSNDKASSIAVPWR